MDETVSDDGLAMDPITTAAGLAKVAGAAAGTANTIAKNSLVHNLLGPVTKAYGDHWGEQARANLKAGLKEAAEAKKAENLSAHARAVRDRIGDDFKPDPALSEEWVAGAEGIDPQDAELAAAWRGVLLAIGSGEIQRRRLLNAVQSLSPEEAHAFMAIYVAKGAYSESVAPYRSRLESYGLLIRPLDFLTNRRHLIMYVMMICIIGFTIAINYLLPALFPYSFERNGAFGLIGTEARSFVAFAILLSTLSIVISALQSFYRFRLTKLGVTLGSFSARAMAAEDGRAETANEEAAASNLPKRKRPPKPKVTEVDAPQHGV